MRNVRELSENEAIHCPTEEQAIELMKLFDSANLRWMTLERYTEVNKWRCNEHNTVYFPARGVCGHKGNYAPENIYNVTEFLPTKTNNTMATKVTILGEQPIEQEKKKIEFVYAINIFSGEKEEAKISPCEWGNIELVKKDSRESGLDVMLAYHSKRVDAVLYLGHFNDGIV